MASPSPSWSRLRCRLRMVLAVTICTGKSTVVDQTGGRQHKVVMVSGASGVTTRMRAHRERGCGCRRRRDTRLVGVLVALLCQNQHWPVGTDGPPGANNAANRSTPISIIPTLRTSSLLEPVACLQYTIPASPLCGRAQAGPSAGDGAESIASALEMRSGLIRCYTATQGRDMGFERQVHRVLGATPAKRATAHDLLSPPLWGVPQLYRRR